MVPKAVWKSLASSLNEQNSILLCDDLCSSWFIISSFIVERGDVDVTCEVGSSCIRRELGYINLFHFVSSINGKERGCPKRDQIPFKRANNDHPTSSSTIIALLLESFGSKANSF